jgi:PAS domain-containing protein
MDGGSIKPALPREGILVQTGFGPEAAGFSGSAGEVLTMTPTEERAPVDRTAASGSVGLVLVVAVTLVAIAVLLLFVGREWAEPYILVVLSLLAMVGVFALFGQAAGVLEFAGRGGKNDLTQALADGAGEGIALVDWSGRVLYANRSYLNLTDAEGPDDVRPVERLFTNDPGRGRRDLPAGAGGARREFALGRNPHYRRRDVTLAARARQTARQTRAASAHCRMGCGRHLARTRTAGKHVSRTAARHRFSRPRAGGFFLARSRGARSLYQWHACGLARLRSRGIRAAGAFLRRSRPGPRVRNCCSIFRPCPAK